MHLKVKTELITVLKVPVCCLSLLRVYACVSCPISILLVYMYVRMSSSPGSIAGLPLSQALPGYLITAPHLYAFLMLLARYFS